LVFISLWENWEWLICWTPFSQRVVVSVRGRVLIFAIVAKNFLRDPFLSVIYVGRFLLITKLIMSVKRRERIVLLIMFSLLGNIILSLLFL